MFKFYHYVVADVILHLSIFKIGNIIQQISILIKLHLKKISNFMAWKCLWWFVISICLILCNFLYLSKYLHVWNPIVLSLSSIWISYIRIPLISNRPSCNLPPHIEFLMFQNLLFLISKKSNNSIASWVILRIKQSCSIILVQIPYLVNFK